MERGRLGDRARDAKPFTGCEKLGGLDIYRLDIH